MSALNEVSVYFPAAPVSKPRSFGELLSKLPEEIILYILEYTLLLPGTISRTDFWGGQCEWPSCPCQKSDWKHVPADELASKVLGPLLAVPEPIPRLAQFVFYNINAFHLCDPQNDMEWSSRGFWLPPQDVHQWVRRLEVEIQITNARLGSSRHTIWSHGVVAPLQDWLSLRRIQHAVRGFTALRTLRLMFEAIFVTKDAQLRVLDNNLSVLEPFHFHAPELILEACSAYPVWLDDDEMSGDIVHDERLGRLLAKYVSATGRPQCIDAEEDCIGAGDLWYQGK